MYSQVGVISGPCHAEEIAMGRLSYLTVATEEEEQGQRIAELLKTPFIKTILSSDIYWHRIWCCIEKIFMR